ncbi:hypothetical protein ABT084_36590 [Streptomyces sp. NPDC002138]|uniref:hypothetical protein n=1 Tax=Streptomyces sp. NPDC002138 TaxID=3154410 RepID=UPI00332CC4B4
MTDRQATDARDQLPNHMLERHQRSLEDGLHAVLDVEAGLCEVLLPSRHNAMVNDLATVLDIESGLGAIVPAPLPVPGLQPSVRAPEGDVVAAEHLIRSVSPQARLALRVHPDVQEACRQLGLGLDRVAEMNLTAAAVRRAAGALDHPVGAPRADDFIDGFIRRFVGDVDHARDVAGAVGRDLARALALALARDCAPRPAPAPLVRAIGRVRNLDHVRNNLDRVRALVHELTCALAGIPDLDHYLARALDIVIYLDMVRALDAVRDFKRHPFDYRYNPGHLQSRVLDITRYLDRAGRLAEELVRSSADQVKDVISEVLDRRLPTLSMESVDAFLNDFTTSDLRTADLKGLALDGVRWSESGTNWPDAVDVEDLKNRSLEAPAGSGIWVVRSGTATVRDLAELT